MKLRSEDTSRLGKLMLWGQRNKMIIKFCIIFVICLGGFSYILQLETIQTNFTFPHLNHVAWICGKTLNTLGTQCDVYESSISSARFSVQVVKGCESIYPTAMLWSALLAYPALLRWKVIGIVCGAAILFILNIIRVITMFYIGIYFPSLFDMVHIYAWQALFILLTLAVFLFWAAKVSKKETTVGL